MQIELKVDGMHCSSCARAITAAMSQVPEVKKVEIKLDAGRVAIEADAGVEVPALIAAAADAGYIATVVPST